MVPVFYSITVLDLKILTWEEKTAAQPQAQGVLPAAQTTHAG
jgi:hypothetical protein